MSHIEAIEDGVKISDGSFGRYTYYIPCEICGRKIRRTQYSRKRTYICDYCKGLIKEKEKPTIPEGTTKHELRFEKAIEKIRSSVEDFKSYDRAIKIAKTRCESYGSIPEAMAAIELLKNGFKIVPQQKIGKFRVDFAIPSIKLILEIDGKIYHKDKQKEAYRDYYIYTKLGMEWKIIHYPAEYIENGINKLVPYIESVRIKKK